jgi:FkbM family methyltransferase
MILARLRYQLTKAAIALGPSNPLVHFLLQQQCQKHQCELVDAGSVLRIQKGNRAILLSNIHFVYAPDIAERFDLYFETVVPVLRDGGLVVDYSRPAVHTYKSSGLPFELAAFPEEQEAVEGYFHWYRPQPGDRVFDIGAHCGVSTYHLSKLVGSRGRVIAFEPDALNHALLLRNIERHGLTNVTVVKSALAEKTGRAEFHHEGTLGSCLSHWSRRRSVGNTYSVETITLSDAFRHWGIPDFCKMDIEGAELGVIEEASQLLRITKTQFALDTNHIVKGSLTALRIEKMFRAYGFHAASAVIAGSMTTWAQPSSTENLAKVA